MPYHARSTRYCFGTVVTSFPVMAYATYKTVEVATPRTSLTPCILDDDPAERYEALATGDPEEALRLIRLGRCRLLLVSVHLDAPEPYEFLDRALRCDPGLHFIVMTGATRWTAH
jgi:hypothetical protein